MTHVTKLAGLEVINEQTGTKGKVLSAEPGKVVVEWGPKQETLLESSLEGLTVLSEGKSMQANDFVEVHLSLAEELMGFLEATAETEGLEEAKGAPQMKKGAKKTKVGTKTHNPFKHQSLNGPGPDHDFGQRKVGVKRDWSCSCANYVCQCKGIGDLAGRKKTVRISRSYRKKYNSAYKKWRKS